MKNGSFVISLDFELHWGVFDIKSVKDYKSNLTHTRSAINEILRLSKKYDVDITFATVGLLFGESNAHISKYLPESRPNYTNKNLNAYPLIKNTGISEEEDPFHFAPSILKNLVNNTNHEIGTHTFTHYYCLENGQTKEDFEADLQSAMSIALESFGLSLKSIVFPRNQVNPEYLSVCRNNGIVAYRGTEKYSIYQQQSTLPVFLSRILRLADSYINIYGHHTYPYKDLSDFENKMVNVPSSRFLRPYSNLLKYLEPLKLKRIKSGMKYAAKNGHLYHLWWHPHNFGSNLNENLKNLEEIFKYYSFLQKKYAFTNETMISLAHKITNQAETFLHRNNK
ncbi:polysaccharide deacetylase family protein [Robiginitalea sp. IMCC44478]|uniref:polysaccharide deacetylase family protein n=1 Tax=Robiginitalea sp. IMCC44478 TaxID=3459122 RepID=UPI00404120E2